MPMVVRLLLLHVCLFCLAAANSSYAQSESIPLVWDEVHNATGYRVCYSTEPLDCPIPSSPPAQVVDVGADAYKGYLLTGLQEATEYHIAVKALNNGKESERCSNILNGWPTPRVDNVIVSPPVRVSDVEPATWRVTISISGHNFKSDGQSYYTEYEGLRIISHDQPTDKLLSMVLEYDVNTPSGEASLLIVNHDGVNCDPRPSVQFTGCVTIDGATVLIQPEIVPGPVRNLDWWLR